MSDQTQPTQADIVASLTDFRHRVIEADKLRTLGDEEGAEALMPSREEVIEAVKAYRRSIEAKATRRSASAQAKTQAATIAAMDNLADLFKT